MSIHATGPAAHAYRHGFYMARMKTCDACGTPFTARRLSARYCSETCRVQRGAWSWNANHADTEKNWGVAKP